jgi:hypothetical protein
MRHISAILLLLFAHTSFADGWASADVWREVAFESLLIVDWGQTRYAAQDPKQRWEEQNPWIGRHPTTQDVDRYFISWLVIHPVISHFLPSEWRKGFQSISIFVEVVSAHQNATTAGIGYRLPF